LPFCYGAAGAWERCAVFVILWLNEHRLLVVAVLGASMWIGAYAFYFRGPLKSWLTKGRPHNWSVDMLTKKAVSRGQEQV
jgi:hypothetical protein